MFNEVSDFARLNPTYVSNPGHALAGNNRVTARVKSLTMHNSIKDEYSELENEFDETYYAETYPGLSGTEPDLLVHFITHGWKEGRNPTPCFNTRFYLDFYPDVKELLINPFYHYIKWGKAEKRVTNEDQLLKEIYSELSETFDAKYYAESYPDVLKREQDLLLHYIKRGWKEGRNPAPYFDTEFYLDYYPEIKGLSVNPFYHYVKWGKSENRLTNHDQLMKEIHAVLDSEFDENYYAGTYPEIAKKGVDPVTHYIEYGWKKGLNPTPYFNTRFYLKNNPDVEDLSINPFYHYLKWGKSEKRHSQESVYKPLESKLLLYCARTRIDNETRDSIRDLAGRDIDWEYVQRSAAKNGVIPLIYRALADICPESIPGAVLNKMHERVEWVVSINEQIQKILLDILTLFDKEKIPVVPFKGVTFILCTYGDLSLRETIDVDLLVHRKEFLRAKDLLIRNGYHHMYFGIAEVQTVQAQLARDDNKMSIDLHYALTPKFQEFNVEEAKSGSRTEQQDWNKLNTSYTNWFFSLDSSPMWKRLGSITMCDKSVPVLSPEDLLMVATIQCIKEYWQTLKRICDVAEIIKANPGLNWSWLMEQFNMVYSERKFLLCIRLAYDVYKITLPEDILMKITNSKLEYLSMMKRFQYCHDYDSGIRLKGFSQISLLLTTDRMRDLAGCLGYIYRHLRVRDNISRTISNNLQFLNFLISQIRIYIAYKKDPENIYSYIAKL